MLLFKVEKHYLKGKENLFAFAAITTPTNPQGEELICGFFISCVIQSEQTRVSVVVISTTRSFLHGSGIKLKTTKDIVLFFP